MDNPNVARPGATSNPGQAVQPGNTVWKGGLGSNAMNVHEEHLKPLTVPMETHPFTSSDPSLKPLHIDLEK